MTYARSVACTLRSLPVSMKPGGTGRVGVAAKNGRSTRRLRICAPWMKAGFDSIKHTLRHEPYTVVGLDNRYRSKAYNRNGIDDRLGMLPQALCAEFLRIQAEAADIANTLKPGQAELTAPMPIYNQPVQIVEALSIM